MTVLPKRDGCKFNHRRVELIWRQVGLKVPQKHPRRGRRWLNDGSCIRLLPPYRNHVGANDSLADSTHEGLPIKILTVIDEFTRECLALVADQKLASKDVLDCLAGHFARPGPLEHIRLDNGSEFTANSVLGCLDRIGVKTLFIEPGNSLMTPPNTFIH